MLLFPSPNSKQTKAQAYQLYIWTFLITASFFYSRCFMKQLWNDFVSFMCVEEAKAGFAYQSESSQETSSNSASLRLKLSRQMQFTAESS